MTRHQTRDYFLNNPAEYYWEDDKTPLSDEDVSRLIDNNDIFAVYLETGTILTHDEVLEWAISVDEEGDPDLARDLARGF